MQVNTDVLDTVLLSLHPESKVKSSEVSERTKASLKELHCFNALIHLDKMTDDEMECIMESLPYTYATQLGENNTCSLASLFPLIVRILQDASDTPLSQL